MSARVLVVSVDAGEASLIERWAAEGDLPTFAQLTRAGTVYRLNNSMETLPGAIWPELMTGRSCGKVPLFFHPAQLHTGEAKPRPVRQEDVNSDDFYWSIASRAGRRIAVIDQPQSVHASSFNGVQLKEWALHDRTFSTESDPPELLAEIFRRYGDHPITSCDRHGGTRRGYDSLLDGLQKSADQKSEFLSELIGRERWDLFTAVFAESHCVGHQFWHFQDPDDPKYEVAGPQHLINAIRSVYQRIDSGLGRLVAAAGPDAFVIVVASHGMGPYIGGYQLLPEVLVRLGMGSDQGAVPSRTAAGGESAKGLVRALARRLKGNFFLVPRAVRPALWRLSETTFARRVLAGLGSPVAPMESPNTKAAALKNNRCGAIRLNLRGREPFGLVEPGAEAEALMAELREELLALTDPSTGQTIVSKVVTAEEAFGAEHHLDVPDMMVIFRTDLGKLERCESPRLGKVHVPLFNPHTPRSGDHTTDSRLWLVGPGIPATDRTLTANVLDLAPSVLRLLDVPLPGHLDGKPLPLIEACLGERKAAMTSARP